MNPSDAAQVLTYAAVFDNRTFDEATCRVWADAMQGLELADCLEAVRMHYRRSRQWLLPADIRELARSAIKRRREIEAQEAERLAIETAVADKETVARRMAEIRAAVEAAKQVPAS